MDCITAGDILVSEYTSGYFRATARDYMVCTRETAKSIWLAPCNRDGVIIGEERRFKNPRGNSIAVGGPPFSHTGNKAA